MAMKCLCVLTLYVGFLLTSLETADAQASVHTTYYVDGPGGNGLAEGGSDGNPGTIEAPLADHQPRRSKTGAKRYAAPHPCREFDCHKRPQPCNRRGRHGERGPRRPGWQAPAAR